MAAYRRVYDSRHLQADCQEPGSATLGNRVWATFYYSRYSAYFQILWLWVVVVPNKQRSKWRWICGENTDASRVDCSLSFVCGCWGSYLERVVIRPHRVHRIDAAYCCTCCTVHGRCACVCVCVCLSVCKLCFMKKIPDVFSCNSNTRRCFLKQFWQESFRLK